MKLYNQDFKRIISAHKAVKTVLKSENTSITLFSGTALITSDDESRITQVLVDIDATTDIPINLDGVTSALLSKCKTKDDLIITDKIMIAGRELANKLPYISLEDIPVMIDPSKFLLKLTCKASLFKEQLKAVSVATAKDELRPVLQNVLLEQGKLVAIDGFRIFTRNLCEFGHPPMLLQKHTVDVLLKLLPNKSDELLTIYIEPDTNNTCVSWGNYSVIDTLGQGEYMKWQQAFTDDYEYKLTVDRKKFIEALEFVINSSLENKTLVKFLLKENSLIVGQDELKADYSKYEGAPGVHFKELPIAFNPRYFIESLKDLNDETITLRFISSLTPCIVEHSKGQDLILPIRLNN